MGTDEDANRGELRVTNATYSNRIPTSVSTLGAALVKQKGVTESSNSATNDEHINRQTILVFVLHILYIMHFIAHNKEYRIFSVNNSLT